MQPRAILMVVTLSSTALAPYSRLAPLVGDDMIRTSIAVAISDKGIRWGGSVVHVVFLIAIGDDARDTFKSVYKSLFRALHRRVARRPGARPARSTSSQGSSTRARRRGRREALAR